MIQEGKIHVEDSIGKYFSEIPDNHPVTLKRLANHTSGLPGIGVLKNIYNLLTHKHLVILFANIHWKRLFIILKRTQTILKLNLDILM